MKCFYHNDSDGKCSGFWIHKSLMITDSYAKEFIEIDYRTKFPMKSIYPNEQVYIVDFSISPDDMIELLKITKDVTWIDHHKTSIEKYKDFEPEIRGVRYDGVAGCMLTYCYLNHMTQKGQKNIIPFNLLMTEAAPMFTKLIADWDVWKFDFGDNTRYFQIAFDAYDFSPSSKNWLKFFKKVNFEQEMIHEGVVMAKYRDSWAKEYIKMGFDTIFEGHKCFAVNLGMANSDYFKSIKQGKYEIFMLFSFDGDLFKISMYSDSVDVSKIAIKYGGGGHKGASGFQCKELPFKKS
ncbi:MULTISPECIES: DHHA1 domain-containing protein [unclassified Clostridium]|uniref:DHHA1 domain-containing protein n=1 Tax=unclassified Clostridium TaxID=2614128 RepID=UPI0002984E4F|nr:MULTISPECIES: DHHA1 domain-containing protein [unclassified Clostridium]EKQ56803.1 MAG: putative DHD superfamily phosphohydrolase [Clostridium sp. Maddingley MBC34-26]